MKIGLVLSGGGARGIAHLGVLQALDEYGVKPDIISGTSAGAIAGSLYSYGYEPADILEILSNASFVKYMRPAFSSGLFSIVKGKDLLLKYLPEDNFDVLKIPLIVSATDIEAGETVYFEKGELAGPVLAASCLPGMFEPFILEGRKLMDGGILNNMPVEIVAPKVDFVIGSHCNPFALGEPLQNTRDVIARTYLLAIHSKNLDRIARCDLLIEPPSLRRFSIFDIRKAKDIFNQSYDYAIQLLENSDFSPPTEIYPAARREI